MRAVIASAFPREREETKAVLSALGCEEICLCAGGVAALNEVRKRVTDVLVADDGQFIVAEVGDFLAAELIRTRRRPVQAAQDVHERRFS